MSLPFLPLLTGDDHKDLITVYGYIYNLIRYFPNAAGSAIDPSMGQGGDASLTVTEAPTDIVYTPSSSLAIDGALFGSIDVSFTKPDRAVDVIVYYKEHTDELFKQSYASSSPFRLISLKVGTEYDIQLAGQAANGSLGPLSELVTITIPTSAITTSTPMNFQARAIYQGAMLIWSVPVTGSPSYYEVQKADDALFTVNAVSWFVDATRAVDVLTSLPDSTRIGFVKYYRVRSVDKAGGLSAYTASIAITTLNVPNLSINTAQLTDNAITTIKITDKAVTYAKVQDVTAASRILLRGSAAGAGTIQEGTVGSLLRINGTVLEADPNTGWSTSGTATDKVLVSGDTLVATQDVLGTLITTLIGKGVLSA